VGTLCEFVAVNGDVDEVAPWIVVLSVQVEFRTICDVGVDCELGFENSVVGVELVLDQGALGSHQVGSAQSLNFPLLQLSILFVKAFRASASAGGQILEILELPVSPARKIVISMICYLVDFLGAGTFSETSTELSNDEWYSKSLGVFSPLPKSSSMELITHSGMCDLRLTSSALSC